MRILLVDDDKDLCELFSRRFALNGATPFTAHCGEDALQVLEEHPCDVALIDLSMPGMNGIELLRRLKESHAGMEVVMLTAQGTIESAIEAMRLGAYDYLTKPVRFEELELRTSKAFEKAQLTHRQQQWSQHVEYESARHRLIGSSAALQKVIRLIHKVAPTDATVLIRGESGTGKELVARALHYNSPRSKSPLVTINCAALQETLLESELFGHEKGSFTGATQAKTGLFEVAKGGTLFVDEIGEMAAGLQAKLLRVLEDGHYRRVGGTRELQAEVRIVAATNRDLEQEMEKGNFREDLYYRLNVVTVPLPSLRERKEDIPELVDHFLKSRAVGGIHFQIDSEVMDILTQHDWPGNIRELANLLERAQILAEDNLITVDDLPETLLEIMNPHSPQEQEDSPTLLREVERRHIQTVLEQEKGNKVQTAKALGVSRRSLYRLLSKHRLENYIGNSQSSEDENEA